MSIDWSKFSNIDYWFSGAAGSFADVPTIDKGSVFFAIYLNTFAFIFLSGIAMNIAAIWLDATHPLVKRLTLWGTNFSWIGFLGFSWFFLRETKVAFFGARFWVLIGLVWFSVILVLMARYFITFYKLEISYYNKKAIK
jgi:hypothetical protein